MNHLAPERGLFAYFQALCEAHNALQELNVEVGSLTIDGVMLLRLPEHFRLVAKAPLAEGIGDDFEIDLRTRFLDVNVFEVGENVFFTFRSYSATGGVRDQIVEWEDTDGYLNSTEGENFESPSFRIWKATKRGRLLLALDRDRTYRDLMDAAMRNSRRTA